MSISRRQLARACQYRPPGSRPLGATEEPVTGESHLRNPVQLDTEKLGDWHNACRILQQNGVAPENFPAMPVLGEHASPGTAPAPVDDEVVIDIRELGGKS